MKPRDLMQDQIVRAVTALRGGGLVILPTETFYGIACNPLSARATGRLLQIKGREGKPLPLIAGNISQVNAVTRARPPLFDALARAFWPGPLTLVLPAAPDLPEAVTAGTGTVGVRIPGPSFALDLARAFGGCITATSANPPGDPPPATTGQLDAALAAAVDLVVDAGPSPGGEPSTVLDLTVDPPAILRPGSLHERLRAFLGSR